jgi:hypothetical protein
MKFTATIALETLESRTLYSTTPSPTVAADMVKVQADKDQINVDQSAGYQTADADNLQLDKDQLAKLNAIAPLQIKLQTDLNTQTSLLLTDNQTALTQRFADRTIVTEDLMSVKADRQDPTALAGDMTKLTADRAALATVIAAANTQYKNDAATLKAAVLADRLAIADARVADVPAVDNDKLKILTDKLANAQTLLADEKQLAADELQLLKDKIARV